jgi:hypothetical protein
MQRLLAAPIVLLLALSISGAAPKKKSPPPAPVAPDVVPHSIALFLGSLSKDGTRSVTFKATALGTRFFIEEPTGVTVYRYDRGHYVKQEFLRGVTLTAAVKKVGGK